MKVVISGYGKMGHMVEEVLKEKGIPCAGATEDVANFDDKIASQSVCIDFTTPEAFKANYKILAEKFAAVVVGTTGWQSIADEVISYFEKCETPMIYASNFSLGVNVAFAIMDLAADKLAEAGYKPSIIETHHVHKLDAPSGTAATMAAIVAARMGTVCPIESRRIGEVPGIHELSLVSDCDKITIVHEAFSRKGFAEGAVMASQMIDDVKGVHEFKDLIF